VRSIGASTAGVLREARRALLNPREPVIATVAIGLALIAASLIDRSALVTDRAARSIGARSADSISAPTPPAAALSARSGERR